MGDDSLDELVDRSPGPDGHPRLRPAALGSDAEGSSDSHSGASEDDSGSEHSDEDDADGDLEDGSGSEDSEEDGDDVDTLAAAADTQGMLEASGVFNSDDDSESCPICLNAFREQAVGTPENCAHYFCLDCIVEWSKNANSCPVDRTIFKCICIRAQFGGKILKKIPVESAQLGEDEDEDPTFCEVCGRSDREDRLLLCDGCDAGYHMECLDPPLQEVPVDEWFCPECAAPGAASVADTGPVSEEEVSLLLADVVPTTSRLRPRTGRTRAIARTRQSERVRATVNRNRISTARRFQRVPRYLMSSLLDETIEAVAAGLSTAVYQRPGPRAPARRRRKAGRRKKASGRKRALPRSSAKSRSSGARLKKRSGRAKKRRVQKTKNEATVRSRIARTLGLCRPARGACTPSVYKPADPSLGLMRADIGAASLSLFGDPYELDPFDSSEEASASPASPLSAKRRVLSRSALRSHQPVARPISMGLSRRSTPATAPQPEVDAEPSPDLLGSILSGQSLLMMNGADIVIHRDGSLSAKRAVPVSLQRSSAGPSRVPEGTTGHQSGRGPQSLGPSFQGRAAPAPTRIPAVTSGAVAKPDSSVIPRLGQSQTLSSESIPGIKQSEDHRFNGDSKHSLSLGSAALKISHSISDSPSKSAVPGQAPRPAPRRTDISELPRIPKIRRDGSRGEEVPASRQGIELPSSCISRLTGREGPGQPGCGARVEGEPSNRGAQEPSTHSGGGPQAPGPLGPARGKTVGSTFESFRINIPGNTAHSGRLLSPGFCNTFRPVDSKLQRRASPSPLFSVRKTKQLRSEIYDPFNPTGSDSSSANSSPERLGLLPSEITRTISVDSPKAPALPPVRCVTSYTVQTGPGKEPEPPQGPSSLSELQDAELCAQAQRPSPPEPWGDEELPPRSSFFGSEGRTVTCVTVLEPNTPPSLDAPPATTHRVVELRSPTRSRSRSSSRSRKKGLQPRAAAREHQAGRSGSRSSRSGDRSSRSASPPAGEDQPKRHRPKARGRRSSSERSSSRERAKRKKAKDKSRERGRGSWGRGRRRSRSHSHSGSPGSSSHERREGRRKKRRRSGSRSRGRECSPPRHPRERRGRPRDRRGSRERRRRRSRSPSPEHRPRVHRRPRSREKRPRPRPHSPERKLATKEASPAPSPQGEPRPDREPPARSPARPPSSAGADGLPEGPEVDKTAPLPEVLTDCPAEDVDYGDSVEAGHLFEDFSSDTIFMQLDDMSSPPSPESTDSSPERDLLPKPTVPPADPQQDTSLAVAVIRREVSRIHGEDVAQPSPGTEGPQEKHSLQQDADEAATVPCTLGAQAPGGTPVGKEEGPSQNPLLRAKALVKRVTWNLQEAECGAPANDRGLSRKQPCGLEDPRTPTPVCWPPGTPLHRPPKPQEGVWDSDDVGSVAGFQQAPFSELPAPAYALPEPGFPPTDPSQVQSPSLPPGPALPSGIPPYAPISQPAVQFLLQGSLPLPACGAAQSLAPVSTILTAASEPAGHAATTTAANNSEERTAPPRPAPEKAKNEEYMKKLHVQERAVEEVKLAIKPFYQKREVTKDEYKDILRKAVQKICHSKSGEINPVKVGNLVRAYVDKYRHMRRHRRAEAGEEPPAQGAEG
ncbi:PHD and RING finger domain-containing protein 1 isoform X1 [Moschus berezovskii]|uniref:PHD and RING finger domain-containing protein 1 isoform X1 n=1 Tax=Moschus berezovskii TaxID=68408 RepID=UPI002444E756|nr:PHD and RING finger domain-containing protein 1 isoform X1 [Moschus berezovskii]